MAIVFYTFFCLDPPKKHNCVHIVLMELLVIMLTCMVHIHACLPTKMKHNMIYNQGAMPQKEFRICFLASINLLLVLFPPSFHLSSTTGTLLMHHVFYMCRRILHHERKCKMQLKTIHFHWFILRQKELMVNLIIWIYSMLVI